MKCLLAYLSTKGFVADFIGRYLIDNPHSEWEDLKQALVSSFSPVIDKQYALLLR